MTFVSYAQNFEDVLLWRALRGVTNGFYIDVGAAHPDIDSVTRAFYDRGWNGINVEPTPEYSLRLAAARPRDINLKMVLGERLGQTQLFVVEGTGLSTIEQSSLAPIRNAGMDVHAAEVVVETLARVCSNYAAETIHFLKIDVEGAERAVLAGADFVAYRPWIVIVEAMAPMSTTETHSEWEFILLDADYRFVWFDGLNRFYVAGEMHKSLKGSFAAPPNVFDDFLRAADSEWVRRIHEAESHASILRERLLPAELRLTQLLERAVAAEGRASYEALAAAHARVRCNEIAHEATQLREALRSEVEKREAAQAEAIHAGIRVAGADANAAMQAQRAIYEAERSAINETRQLEAVAAFEAMRASTSWRITAPLRRLRSKRNAAGPVIMQAPAPARADSPGPSVGPSVAAPSAKATTAHHHPRPYRTTVHQFHSGAATGDAITNSMLLTRKRLRDLGYRSEIFVSFRDAALAAELRLKEELPRHEDYVLILRHSMGFDAFEEIAALPAPKILLYHNITPPDLLQGDEFMQRSAEIGRQQLSALREKVCASLADSEFNAIELRTLGFSPVQVCESLLDTEALLARVASASRRKATQAFTILFVGRIVSSKGQAELVDVFASFRNRFGRPCRLVLVGRDGGPDDVYFKSIESRVVAYNIVDDIVLTGVISDDELHDWYASADIYVSLSRHEGFGVPLVEAMAHDLPVLARAAGAVPYTLGNTGGVFLDDTTETVVERILELANNKELRTALIKRQRVSMQRFRWIDNKPALLQALSAAGAAPPIGNETRIALASAIQITVTGHVSGTYSLAAINRTLALSLNAVRPGAIRVLPVDGEPTGNLDVAPDGEQSAIAKLLVRSKPVTGPHVVISQHYPVHVPREPGDIAVAYFFWEESVVPLETIRILNKHFRGVFAPSEFVSKSLVDSGLSIPVRVVGFSPRLDPFFELADARRVDKARVFTFLHISSGFPRKGIDALLEAFRRAFRRSDPVRLVIKVFPNPHNDVSKQIGSLLKEDPEAPEIALVDRDIDDAELLELYRDADAVVLPTRGEGFNLPAAEAMAAGLPLIVTGFGGHLDFCNDTVRLVDYSFARSASHLAVAGSVWVEPDVEDLTRALSKAVWDRCSPSTPPSLYSARLFAEKTIDAAVDLLLAQPRQPCFHIGWVSSWGVRCGVAEYSRHLIEAMLTTEEDASEITVFCDTRTSPEAAEALDVSVVPCWGVGLSAATHPLVTAIAARDPDVLVIQHQPGLIAWPALAELISAASIRARPVVVMLHSTRRILDMEQDERDLVIEALGTVARIIVHTIEDLNRLKGFGLVTNVAMIPQGAVGSGPDAIIPAIRIDGRPAVIGCYGFFFAEKGIPQLIEAVARLRRHSDIKLRLVNAEYGTPESAAEIARCRAAAESAGLTDAVEWHTGFLSDKESIEHLRTCDLIVLPYQTSKEGSSAALRMALSSGVPVAVTPLPLFNEAEGAVHRFHGIESADLEDGITLLLSRPQSRGELQDQARAWLASREWPAIAARFHGMLKGLHVNFVRAG